MKIWTLLLMLMVLSGEAPGPVMAQNDPDQGAPILVGHITHVEGQLLRYVPEEQDWLAVVQDAPFGLEDTLYTTRTSRAEIRLPNRTLIRLQERTQIQLLALEEEFTEIDLYIGTARFYHQGPGTIKVYTPFGLVQASSGAVFDVHAREKVTEVLALRGTPEFRPAGAGSGYRVSAGGPSLVADGKQVNSGAAGIDPAWQSWNSARDQAAARYRDYAGASARYLPPDLEYQAPVLDENGQWEQVPYQGEVYYFWRPLRVVHGWAPFTVGRWTVWYDDPCWIPAEPFGYVTHHYGNWFFIRGSWYWAPPVRVRHRPHPLPLFPIAWAWYPGRVAWIHHGAAIGWIPLAPHEPYYCRRYWGPRAVVVKDPQAVPIHINRYLHAHHAVTVHRDNFFAVPNYHPFRLAPLKRETVIRDFQPLPVLDRPFLNGADPLRRKHQFTAAVIREKPRPASVDRIRLNQARFREMERISRHPEALPNSPPAMVPPGPGPGFSPPVRETKEPPPIRKKELPDRWPTPAPTLPFIKEAPEGRPKPLPRPESRTYSVPGAPAPRIQDREIEKNTPETFRPPPAVRSRSIEDRELRERGPRLKEFPKKEKEPPVPRKYNPGIAPGSAPANPEALSAGPSAGPPTKERPVKKRIEAPKDSGLREAGPKSSRELVPRGKESREKNGKGVKER